MADQTTPDTSNQQWFLNPAQISQAPYLQSWAGHYQPFANQQDQIQQSMMISGVFPGEMPYNGAMGNTTARYAFGRSVPGTSPAVGSNTNYMQNYSGQNPQTGVQLGLLGQSGTNPGQNTSMFQPTGQGYAPGTYPPPGGYGPNPNVSPPGQPAPPFPPISDPTAPGVPPRQGGGPMPPVPPGAGQSNRGAFNTGMWNGTGGLGGGGGLLGGNRQTQQQLNTTGTQALQGVSDPATRYMMAMAYRIPPASIGLTPEQINQYEQSTMGQTYNRKTGQVQRNY